MPYEIKRADNALYASVLKREDEDTKRKYPFLVGGDQTTEDTSTD